MASIQRREGVRGITYRARVKVRGRVRMRTFNRLVDARQWASGTETALTAGRRVPNAEELRRFLGDLIDRYIEETLPLRAHKDIVNPPRQLGWWKDRIGDVPLIDLDGDVIGKGLLALSKGKTFRGVRRGAATCNRYLSALSAALAEAVRWGWLDENPARRVRKLKEPRGRVRFLSEEERKNLLAACKADKNPDLYDYVMLALCTGARRGELMNLTWANVDLLAEPPRITFVDTKANEQRTIPTLGPAFDLLSRRAKVRRIDNPHVFPGPRRGQPLRPTEPFRRAREAAGLEDFRFHDLRHTAASYLLMQGATLGELSEVLGHKTLQMVKRYVHLSDLHTESVLRRLADNIAGE